MSIKRHINKFIEDNLTPIQEIKDITLIDVGIKILKLHLLALMQLRNYTLYCVSRIYCTDPLPKLVINWNNKQCHGKMHIVRFNCPIKSMSR